MTLPARDCHDANLRRLLLLACLSLANLAFAAAPVLGEISAPVAGVIHGAVIRTADAEELRCYVLRGLTDRYATQKGITVGRAEIERYKRHVAAFMKADAAKRCVPLDADTTESTESAEDRAARDMIATAFIK